jgi:hypothetical protein
MTKTTATTKATTSATTAATTTVGKATTRLATCIQAQENDQVPCMIFSIASQTIASSNAHHNIGIVREIEVLRTCRDASVSVDTNMAAQGAPLHNVNATPHLSDDNPAMHWTTQQRQWQ